MVEVYQIAGLAFSAFILYLSFLYYKKKDFTPTEWTFWLVFALGFAGISLFPNMLDPIAQTLSLERKLDLLIILGFMFLITMSFYVYRVTRHTDKRMEELVRRLAMEKKKP